MECSHNLLATPSLALSCKLPMGERIEKERKALSLWERVAEGRVREREQRLKNGLLKHRLQPGRSFEDFPFAVDRDEGG